jgi:hypothetical protein
MALVFNNIFNQPSISVPETKGALIVTVIMDKNTFNQKTSE